MDNTLLLKSLLANKTMRMKNAPFLAQSPEPLPEDIDFDKVEGLLLGLAVGDALGNTSESKSPSHRMSMHGTITHYLPNRHAGHQAKGTPSDDTQLAFWTLEQLLEDDGLDPDHLARRFCQERIFGLGSTVRQFIRRYKDQGIPWNEAGIDSAGNGALMRIAPVLLPHLRNPSASLWADAAIAGMITHNDFASNAACVAFVSLFWSLLGMSSTPQSDWWLESYISVASQLEGETSYSTRIPGHSYRGPIWKFTEDAINHAKRSQLSTLDGCEQWGSGAYLMETIPSVLYILMVYGSDPEQAIIRAVNDTWDNDTVAAIVGAAVGALHGYSALPHRWIENLLGRTTNSDDGKIFSLIEQARKRFFEQGY